MRVMKDSGVEWIGEIPQEWELRKIKTNFDIVAGATPKSSDANYWDGEIPWITPADYTTEDIYVSKGHKTITQDGLSSCATSMIPAGSIIFSKRAPVGLVAINRNPLCTNQGCLSCIPKDEVDAKFYYYVMSIYSEQFDLLASGTTFKEISLEAFANFKLPCPDYETQKTIASYLDVKCSKIDSLIAAKEKNNALLKEWRQSIIYEAVTKGLDPTVPMKDSGVEWIGEIPEGWSVGKTIYALSMPITDGPHETPTLLAEGIPFISAEAVSAGDGKINFEHIRGYISEDYYQVCCKKYTPKKNDIYMIKSGATTGKVALVDTDILFTIWSPLAVFRVDETKCHFRFLFYFLQSGAFQEQVANKWTYGTQQNIGMRTLEKLLICFPSLKEQMEIADFLDNSIALNNELIRKNEMAIQQLKEYRQSVIYEAVTGKIEV